MRTRGQLSKEKGKSVPVEESPISKGSLNDLLEAIELEQDQPIQIEPLEFEQDYSVQPIHIDLTQSSPESSKKSRASKRLKFEEPSKEYAFKPRRPVTRRQIKEVEKAQKEKAPLEVPSTDVLEVLTRTVHATRSKDKSNRVIISQGGNVIAIKQQAGTTQEEVPQIKNVSKERAVRYANYKKAVIKGRTSLMSQTYSVSDAYLVLISFYRQDECVVRTQ